MSAEILDGRKTAAELRENVRHKVVAFREAYGVQPTLVAILVGEDPASSIYVRNKEKACAKAGIAGRVLRLPAAVQQSVLLEQIHQLNADAAVHGILVQLPLPTGVDPRQILDAVDPLKDVDCFSPANVGLLMQGRPRFLPCTPAGIIQLLRRYSVSVQGHKVVVVGRSDIVGKPMAMLLAAKDGPCGPEYANATVTLAHSQTADLPATVRQADIVIAACGQPEFIRGDWLKPGAVVIDVGINRSGERLVGDVAFEEASKVATAVTPVPGGVGPLTIAMLLHNTLQAARLHHCAQ